MSAQTRALTADAAFTAWLLANDERVSAAWSEHLSYMRDSHTHIAYMAQSDACFHEFARERYDAELNERAVEINSAERGGDE